MPTPCAVTNSTDGGSPGRRARLFFAGGTNSLNVILAPAARGSVPGGRGAEATVFSHVIHDGGETFIQYWLYYPDSTSTWMGSAGIWNTVIKRATRQDYPGYHPDDWESVHVRIDDCELGVCLAAEHVRGARGPVVQELPEEHA